jgi:hypothetical protein
VTHAADGLRCGAQAHVVSQLGQPAGDRAHGGGEAATHHTAFGQILGDVGQGFLDGQGVPVVHRHRAAARLTVGRGLPAVGVLAHLAVLQQAQHSAHVLSLGHGLGQAQVEQLVKDRAVGFEGRDHVVGKQQNSPIVHRDAAGVRALGR